jgi:hypothetical protein
MFRKLGPGVGYGYGEYGRTIRHYDSDGNVYHQEEIPWTAQEKAERERQRAYNARQQYEPAPVRRQEYIPPLPPSGFRKL